MITIRHTHAEGTILSGSRKGDGVYEIVRQRDNGGFTWRPEPGIFIRGSRDRDAQEWRINAAAEALRAAGHEVVIEIDNQWRPTAEREVDRADRADERADRLHTRASAAARRAQARDDAGRRVLDSIPFGQPMLVDHHSYIADRNRRERAVANLRAAMEERGKARRLAERAQGVQANQDHRDASRVIMRRIDRLEEDRRRWAKRTDDVALRQVDRLDEEIAYWQGILAERATSGEFVPWGPEDFQVGDEVRVLGRWLPVRRVNKKSVSVPGAFGNALTGNDATWSERAPWDKIAGRRRDGMQLDTPNGAPWPVELAKQVARWRDLLAEAERSHGDYRDGAMWLRIRVARAQRNVHGLAADATDDELTAAQDEVRAQGVEAVRELAAAYLAEYERLAAAHTTGT